MSMRPFSDIQCVLVSVFAPIPRLRGFDDCFCFSMSIQVSAAFIQKTPTEDCFRCAYISGIAPYRVIGESISYSKTSLLYSLYGSLYAADAPLGMVRALPENVLRLTYNYLVSLSANGPA